MSTAQTNTTEMTTGTAASKDGTRIGYLRVGQGPAVVLLQAAASRPAATPSWRWRWPTPSPSTCPTGAAAPSPGLTAPTTASAPRSRTCRLSLPSPAPSGSSGPASAR
jgi:hypothetical protein